MRQAEPVRLDERRFADERGSGPGTLRRTLGEGGEMASLAVLGNARCALCATTLTTRQQRYRLISPLSGDRITVCPTCRRAARGEGYRSL